MGTPEPSQHEHWIIGFDGSQSAEHALRWSIAQSRDRSAAIEVVQAWQPELLAVGDLDLVYQMTKAPEAAHAAFNDVATTLPPVEPEIQWTVEFGNAASTLIDKAEDADLLILGTRGRGGFKRLLLGSVSQQCATHAKVPVAVIPKSAALEGKCQRLVVGMDGSANAKAALRWAISYAPTNATVLVVGAWSLSRFMDADDRDRLADRLHQRFHKAIDEVVDTSARDHVEIVREVADAAPAAELVERGQDADLIVMGARGQGRVASAFLGSVATGVLHQATCPVVIVPDPER